MLLACEKCRYVFAVQSLPDRCPDCGHHRLRAATHEEEDWYYDLQREKENWPLLGTSPTGKAG